MQFSSTHSRFLLVLTLGLLSGLSATAGGPHGGHGAPLRHTDHVHQLRIRNNCSQTIWPGILANFGFSYPENGGFRLNPGSERRFDVEHEWGGQIWGRTGCDEASGTCETGDCGGLIECSGFGGSPPLSFVDIKFDGIGELDYYFLSLMDGYNLQMDVRPVPDTVEEGSGGGGPFDCKPTGCVLDLNTICPTELVFTRERLEDRINHTSSTSAWGLIDIEGGGYPEEDIDIEGDFELLEGDERDMNEVIACMSPCVAFNTDEYCCRGEYDSPATCRGELWAINYPAVVRAACPTAFSYVHDQSVRQSTCRSREPDSSAYEITFCPNVRRI